MLTIGDFSRATLLTIKTLRHYHDTGLLEAAEVDTHTGYRRYLTSQIPQALMIKRFRELRMPLNEIRQLLASPDGSTRNTIIAAHLRRLEDDLGGTRSAVSEHQSKRCRLAHECMHLGRREHCLLCTHRLHFVRDYGFRHRSEGVVSIADPFEELQLQRNLLPCGYPGDERQGVLKPIDGFLMGETASRNRKDPPSMEIDVGVGEQPIFALSQLSAQGNSWPAREAQAAHSRRPGSGRRFVRGRLICRR
jgi:DNA-binding transcriptional MerR regulator